MGSADAAARVQAFLLVRQMATDLPAPTLSNAMKVQQKLSLRSSLVVAHLRLAWHVLVRPITKGMGISRAESASDAGCGTSCLQRRLCMLSCLLPRAASLVLVC